MSTELPTPSSRRPMPFRPRSDLVFEHIGFQGTGYWVAKDPVGLKYHRLRNEQYAVLNLLEDGKSLHTLRSELVRQFPTFRPSLADVQRMVVDMHEKGLVLSERRGQGAELLQKAEREGWKKVRQSLQSLLFLRLPGWDPEGVLAAMLPWTRWCFLRRTVVLATLFVLSSLLLLLVNFDEFQRRLPEFQAFFGWPNVLWMWLAIALTKVLHEFGHGLSCKHFGSECHGMGIMLLVFSPTLYCDTSDSWMLRNKWQRMAIGAAGMYVEVVLSAFALWTWWFAPDSTLGYLCLNVFFVTSVSTVVFNLNPLMRFDGYYILSDFLEIPNLRPQAEKLLKETAAQVCLGVEPQYDPFAPQHGRGWFVLYAIASWVYRWVLLLGISLFLYTVLKPYDLQSIGIGLAVVSIGGMLVGGAVTLYKTFTRPREEPLSRPRMFATLLAFSAVGTAIMLVPLPLHVEAPFVLEPRDVRHLHVKTAGTLTEIGTRSGNTVSVDDELLRFESPDLDEEIENLLLEVDVLKRRLDAQVSLRDDASELTTREAIRSAESQIEDLRRRRSDLVLQAPIAGRVVAAEPRPESKIGADAIRLDGWHGTLLERRNLGAFVEPGTRVLSLAPSDEYVAVLYVGQSIRNEVHFDQKVELKIEELPLLKVATEVESVSDRHDAYVPRALSNKYGGELPTLTEDDGRERLVETAYRIVVPIPDDVPVSSLRSGLRGRARFLVWDRTIGQWLWRAFRQTFQFRL